MKMVFQWSIDDGDVYGLSQAQCAFARAESAREVELGLSPSWPSNAACADDSYTIGKLFAHAVPLTQGAHTLRIGIVTLNPWSVAYG